MAQGNIIQGQASGKLGDTVLMVRNGTQVSRVYTTSGARSGDAASFAARLQRVRFGSASNEWQLYKFICTRMFRKGRNTNQSDYNYFVKRNVDNLPYFTKLENADGVCCMMPGQFSEGNLGRIELLSSYWSGGSVDVAHLGVSDTINPMGVTVSWPDTVAVLKARLKLVYTNARKVTYLIVTTSETIITEGGEAFTSQFFQHHPIVVDLYSESTPGENQMTIKEYFASKIQDPMLVTLINGQSTHFAVSNQSFHVVSSTEESAKLVNSMGVLIFATNDLVSDCYTTILPATSVNLTRGVYSIWAGYRTANALQVACDSYGFQSGVMRDEVASYNGSDTELINAYTAKLRAFMPDQIESFDKDLKALGDTKIKAVRTNVTSSED